MLSYILHSSFHLWLNSRITWENLKKNWPGPTPDRLESQGVNKTHSSPPDLCTDCSLCLESWVLAGSLPFLRQVFLRCHFLNGVSSDLFKLGRTFTPHFLGLIAHISLPCYTLHFLTMVIIHCLPPLVQESVIWFTDGQGGLLLLLSRFCRVRLCGTP